MRYVCTSIAMVFGVLSPMVRARLLRSENDIKAKLEVQSKKLIERVEKKLLKVHSSHFMPIKWCLQVIHESHKRNEIGDRLAYTLIAEINLLHTQCDRLINFKHENFSWVLVKCAMTSCYLYFVVGAVSGDSDVRSQIN